MNDNDVVKQVIKDNFMAWFDHSEDAKLDYYTDTNTQLQPFHTQAAQVSLNVLVFQNWKRHLDNALDVVKNWKAS